MAKKKKGNRKSGGQHSPHKTPLRAIQQEAKLLEWKQEGPAVILIVELPKKPISPREVDVVFTGSSVSVGLKGGRPWKCTLFDEVDEGSSSVTSKGVKVIVNVKKKQPNILWSQLEKTDEKQEAKEDEQKDEKEVGVGKDSPEKGSETNVEKEGISAEKKEDSELGLSDGSDQNEETDKSEETVFHLNHIKHDFFEKNPGVVSVRVYVKKASATNVAFSEKSVAVKFKTEDPGFLKMHEGADANTTFSWFITVFADLKTAECKFRVTSTCIDLTLAKKEAKKWSTLEAQLKQPSSGKPVDNTWTPTVKSSASLSKKVKPEEVVKSKVAFDEMGDMKEKEDVAEKDVGATGGKPSMAGDSLESAQKPTCMVSPLKENSDQVVRPGMTGLDNLGNTCFMNSVLQVLSNSTELRNYFLESVFQREINTDNPLGSGGKLALSFAILLKNLWSGKHYSYSPSKLKNLVAQRASQFSGYAQHDAQEFMAFLLDGLHEDQNRIKHKPYTQTVDSDGRADEIVANEAWAVHKKRNDSIVVDLFQGQYKSKLTCPTCGKVSITFDPFMILPVPMPKKQRLLSVIFMSKDPHRKPVKYMLRLPKDATVELVKKAISEHTGVHHKDLRVFETFKHNIHQIFMKGSQMSSVTPSNTIVVSEVLSPKVAGEPVYELALVQRALLPLQIPTRCSYCRHECPPDATLKRCTRCYRTAYCDKQCQSNDWQTRHRTQCKLQPELVAEPFILSIPQSQATYSRLVQMAEAFSRHSIDVFQPPVSENLKESCAENRDCPAQSEQVDMDNSTSTSDSGFQDDQSPAPSVTSDDTGSTNESASSQTESSSAQADPKADQEKADCDDADKSDDSASPPVPTRYVMGRQRDLDFVEPPFTLKPLERDARGGGADAEAKRLQDHGEEPLDLSDVSYLAMDWKNREKCRPYVLVQSKELDCEEHESMKSMCLEEQREIALDQCFDLFTEPEVLNPEESWYCPECKEHREATKQLSIWRLPSTLIIQLKRFSFRNFICRDKIDKMVEFPTRGLDLSHFYVGNRPANEPPPVYDLYGVINHFGSILGGHYTAFARTTDVHGGVDELGWRLFDDSHVAHTSEKQVVSRSAYVLFYKRRQHTVDIPAQVSAGKQSETEISTAEKLEDEDNEAEKGDEEKISLVPNTASQGLVKSKSGNKPTSTVTASEAKLQGAAGQSPAACCGLGTGDGGGCASASAGGAAFFSLDGGGGGRGETGLEDGLSGGVTAGILPLNLDAKGLSSENSSDFTDMEAVD